MNWSQFSFANSKLLQSYCKILFCVYKYGFSNKFMHSFCAGLATKLPVFEKKYHCFKKKSAKGKLDSVLSKTSEKTESFAVSFSTFVYICTFSNCYVQDFLFARMLINSRYHVQKAAKERQEKLKVKKHNGDLVAARNRKRKRTCFPSSKDQLSSIVLFNHSSKL